MGITPAVIAYPTSTTVGDSIFSINIDVLIIGGGQAGLCMGYHLQKAGINFLIVDSAGRIGDSWRAKWDSLKLFTPRSLATLPGMEMPKSYHYYPLRDEMADYLEAYAYRFAFPIQLDYPTTRLEKTADGFIARSPRGDIAARRVVVAAGSFHTPYIPDCAVKLSKKVWQCHSYGYKNPDQVPPGEVLVVGGGNSGAQLAVELAETHRVTIVTSAKPVFVPASIFGVSLYWYAFRLGILNTPKGSALARRMRRNGDAIEAIVGFDLKKYIKKGEVQLFAHRVSDCENKTVGLEDGTSLKVQNIIWATGFRPRYGWLAIKNATDESGRPIHDKGVSPVNGLYWLGLPWQTRLGSAFISGVDGDAQLLLGHLSADMTSALQ